LAALRKLKKLGGIALALIAVAVPVLVAALWWQPPDLIRVGANYTAKIVCSNVFFAGRDPDEVLRTDVQAPGHPLLRLMRVSVDHDGRMVRAGLFGFIGGGLAVFRPGTGCAVLVDGRPGDVVSRAAAAASAASGAAAAAPAAPWPDGETVNIDAALTKLIASDRLAGPGMRAILVVHDGRLVAERYADGFGPQTPQLGWSMTKSVTAGLIGILVKDGRLALEQPVGSALGWPATDPRARITIADLSAMASGLKFNEGYGAVSDVTRMLYLEPDMAAFASAQPLLHPIGTVWSYSSGSAVILSRIFQDAAGIDALAVVQHRLFEPLGMTSAVMETDEHGTLVGSSYMYATPRDWARYGLLLAQDGIWKGQAILPPGYVALMASPVAASGGEYGHGMVWRWTDARVAGENPDTEFGIPADTFWMTGHDGQYVAVIPSKQLVILRMGLTPSRERYQPEPLVQAVLGAVSGLTPVSNARAGSRQ
jgi:CubicO group peptidase (beta-lactamase class C family)